MAGWHHRHLIVPPIVLACTKCKRLLQNITFSKELSPNTAIFVPKLTSSTRGSWYIFFIVKFHEIMKQWWHPRTSEFANIQAWEFWQNQQQRWWNPSLNHTFSKGYHVKDWTLREAGHHCRIPFHSWLFAGSNWCCRNKTSTHHNLTYPSFTGVAFLPTISPLQSLYRISTSHLSSSDSASCLAAMKITWCQFDQILLANARRFLAVNPFSSRWQYAITNL